MRSFSSCLAHLSPRLFLSIALASAPSLVACGGGGGSAGEDAPKASLRRFGSESELVTYLDQVKDDSSRGGSSSGGTASPSAESAGSSSDSSGAAPPANENVTNNQETGVDEGGIVKNVGDALVVLRKGRLYAVSIAQPGAPQQTDSVAVAPAPELNENVWYDEMLVKGDLVYVVGYRYGLQLEESTNVGYGYRGATEVSSFRLAGGKLERLKVAYFESNDYFSGSNYASRMIDGTLAFYMPHGVWSYYGSADRKVHIPRRFEPTSGGKFTEGAPLFAPTDVYVPIDIPKSPVFHTIVKCELPADGSFSCQARALLSNWGREHYVTKDAVFLWSLPRAYMFRFEDLGVTAHRSLVAPRDQFSFSLREGKLHVAGVAVDPSALENGYGYGYGSSSNGKIVVESLPTADFDVFGEQDLATKSREITSLGQGSAWVNKNRFVGGALFLGVSRYAAGPSYDDGSYGGSGTSSTKLLRVDLASGAVDTRDVAGFVSRIEPMGETRALVATATQGGLALEPMPTTGPLAPTASEQLAGVSEGESRSHGFFFKPDAPAAAGGLFGLPVLNANANGGWGGGISNVGFWRVTEAGGLEKRGIVSSSNAAGVCETSCVDWYGNTRPVFIRDRAFALMGSELAEITLAPSAARLGQAAILGN